MGWTTEGSDFESQEGEEFSFLHVVQIGFGAHPAPIQWVPEGELTTLLQLVLWICTSIPHTSSWHSASLVKQEATSQFVLLLHIEKYQL
jgi:hypothetical protein